MDVGAPRLHRIGNAESAGKALRHRAVREEEAGVDDVEGLLRMEVRDNRKDGEGLSVDVEPAAEVGDDREDRAMDGQILPSFLGGQGAKGGVALCARQWPWRNAERRDHRDPDAVPARQFARLTFDEDAEIGAAHVRKQGRQHQDVQRHRIQLSLVPAFAQSSGEAAWPENARAGLFPADMVRTGLRMKPPLSTVV